MASGETFVDILLDGDKELLLEAEVDGGVVVEANSASVIVEVDSSVVVLCKALLA